MINRMKQMAKRLAEMKESKENAIAFPTAQPVHISTFPLKLAQKALKKKEADSGSNNTALLRDPKE